MTSSRLTVGRTAAGERLDRWLAESLPDLSRSRIQHLIAGQHVTVNGLNVGRNPQETLRVLDALQTDELCPCNWQRGEQTLSAA